MSGFEKILVVICGLQALGLAAYHMAVHYRNAQVQDARTEARELKETIADIVTRRKIKELDDDDFEAALRDAGMLDPDDLGIG